MEDITTWGKQIAIEAKQGSIVANVHYPPAGAVVKGWVVMLHGLGGNRHEHNGIFTRTASALANNAYGAIRFDFRGNGESDFASEFMTLATMREDIESVIAYLQENEKVENLYLLGLSLGGLLAGITVSELKDVKAAVLWEPPFHLIKTLKRLLGPMQFDRIRVRGFIQSGLLKLSRNFVEEFDQVDVNCLNDLDRCPVLLVQGESDEIVTVDDAKLWCESFSKNPKFDSYFVKDADHAFTQENHALDVIAESVMWLNKL